jgi:hypothetical protein
MVWRCSNQREDGESKPAIMAGKDLDALASELADERISRAKALKRIGAALLGGSLLAVFPGVALAQPCPPNRFFLAFDERVRHANGQSPDPPDHRGGPCQILEPSCQTPKR